MLKRWLCRELLGVLTLGGAIALIQFTWGTRMAPGDDYWLSQAVIFGWLVRSAPWLASKEHGGLC